MKFYARREYAPLLRWQTLPMNLLVLLCAPLIYVVCGVTGGLVEAIKTWASHLRDVYGAFK